MEDGERAELPDDEVGGLLRFSTAVLAIILGVAGADPAAAQGASGQVAGTVMAVARVSEPLQVRQDLSMAHEVVDGSLTVSSEFSIEGPSPVVMTVLLVDSPEIDRESAPREVQLVGRGAGIRGSGPVSRRTVDLPLRPGLHRLVYVIAPAI